MAITPIATASADAGSGNVSITHGLTIVAGDVLTAFINVNGTGNTATDNNGSTAFTETTHGDQPAAGSAVMYIFERVAGSSEPSSYAWTLGTSDRWSIVICQDRGVDSTIWDVAPSGANISTDDTGGTTSTCSAITIATSGALGRVAMGDDFNPTTTTFSSVNNSYTLSRSESGQQYIVVAEKAGLSTGSTGTTVITSSSTVRTVQWQMALKPASATVEQEGFRFGVDDGNEASHTWEAAQDTNITTADNLAKLLRVLVNSTGDKAATAYKLKYQKNGSGGYANVPLVASSVTRPVIEAADSNVSGSNTAAASWAVTTPAAVSGDLLIFYIAWDDSTATTGVTAPAGKNSETLTAINATPATDSSTETRAKAWYCVCTGTWTAGTITFTPSATESWSASVVKIPAGEFDAGTPIGATATSAATGTADTNVVSTAFSAGASDGGGALLWFAGVDTDPLSATPPTGWSILENQDLGAVAHGVAVRTADVSNSESIASANWAIAGDSWTSIMVIVRGVTVTNDIYISTSANITAGGEATTARLTAPSGKTTSDFTTGRRWDDENGTDTIDIASDFYTEVEWSLTLKDGLTPADYFDFRVYAADVALDTYTVTPRWTVETPAGTTKHLALLGVG